MLLRDPAAYVALLRERPGSLGLTPGRYDVMVAYLLGVSDGGGVLLVGFEEWLLQHYGGGSNRLWPALVSARALGEERFWRRDQWTDEDHAAALSVLWESLDGFLAEFGQPGGTRRIFRGYMEWEQATGESP
jgi:hypothetical protein